MTTRVYLHVGAPKSGTTYLQSVLKANPDALASHGVAVIGRSHLDLVHAAMVVREDPRLDALPARASGAWQRVLDDIADWAGATAIVSYELLAGATAEQATRALADLAEYDVHVVVTARDLARALPSAWQERLKFALTTPLEQWRPRPETDERSEWGWRTLDPSGVASRWGAGLPAERVHLVTMPRAGGPDLLWQRFAEACGLADVAVDLPDEKANTSLGAGSAELLRRVNEQVADPVTGNREQSLWLRDTLAHRVLAPLDDEPIGLTDEQYAEAEQRFGACRAALAQSGYSVHGEVDDLAPGRRAARTPGQVEDSRLVEVAVRAIWELLLLVRAGDAARHEPRPGGQSSGQKSGQSSGQSISRAVAARPRAVARSARGLVGSVVRRAKGSSWWVLEQRVDALESELALSRQLQIRLAMLTDVVTELLLPLEDQDPARLEDAVKAYRKETL